MSKRGRTKFYLYPNQLSRADEDGNNICCWYAPEGGKKGFWFTPPWDSGIYLVVHSKVITKEAAIVYITEQYKKIGRIIEKQFVLDKLYEEAKTGS